MRTTPNFYSAKFRKFLKFNVKFNLKQTLQNRLTCGNAFLFFSFFFFCFFHVVCVRRFSSIGYSSPCIYVGDGATGSGAKSGFRRQKSGSISTKIGILSDSVVQNPDFWRNSRSDAMIVLRTFTKEDASIHLRTSPDKCVLVFVNSICLRKIISGNMR